MISATPIYWALTEKCEECGARLGAETHYGHDRPTESNPVYALPVEDWRFTCARVLLGLESIGMHTAERPPSA
ncbi:MAG: hypothetical protein HIU88_10120 [Acidobacteria bacterium]|nr:hypothetical protein [Acidobacteriota bacterium]